MSGNAFSLLFFGFNDKNFPYTRISHEILKCCASNGHDVSVFCVKDNKLDSSFIDHRISRSECPNWFANKALTYIFYSFFCFFYVVKTFISRPNTCFIVPTTPPFVLPLVISFVKVLTFGRLKWTYHIQDIHPEISFVGRDKTWKYRFLKAVDIFFIKNSNRAITLSYEMKEALAERDKCFKSTIFVANNFAEEFIEKKEQTFKYINEDRSKGKVIYIFSGNVGKFQRVAEIVTCFLELKIFDGVLYILGDGEELPVISRRLSTHANKERVRLLGRKPFDVANQLAAQCDYGIVSLNPEITKYAYPSKFAAYLSMGLKVLAFVDKNSQIAHEVEDYKLGGVISEEVALEHVIENTSNLLDIERTRIITTSKELFGKDLLVNKNYQLLENVK